MSTAWKTAVWHRMLKEQKKIVKTKSNRKMLKVKCAVCGKGRFTVDCTVSSKQYLTAEMIYIEYIFP